MKPVIANQRGGAMVFVTLVGLVISIAFSLFMTSTVLVEQRAVEGSLAKSRAYWAEMGHIHYAMSRISYSRFCGNSGCGNSWKDTDLVPVLQAYFNELNNVKTWTYADESASYSITVTETAAVDETPGRQTYSGWIKATSSTTASSVVNGLEGHLPLMEVRLCAGRPSGGGGAKCGDIDHNNGGNPTAYFSINRVTNLPG